ncbi:conserved exported hypothetical protein [uncultured delta proteobacterium]|uniref:Tetratricopeptide repeat protein n=1 Tax=uncultured delta proteobacterium TaxID=34034 RepID=A0A212IUC6_9DELT|nr:conserved exported hypothetical protein [uncultured delta proteobacterium]
MYRKTMRRHPRCPEFFRCGTLPLLCLCALLLALSSGCAGRVPTESIRSNLAAGSLEPLEQSLEETHKSYGEFVTALNLARVYQVDGRWADSIKAYNDALVLLEDYESRAVINVRTLLSGAGTVLFSRGADEYYGVGYERSLLHTFNALNYLMLKDFTGAAVEMRRMDKRQEIWLEESQARIEKYLESKKYLESPEDLPPGYSMRDLLLDHDVRGLINNYQDPFSFALAAVLYRLADDSQAADVSMRRAIALSDNANLLFTHCWPGKPPGKTTGKGSGKDKTDAATPPAVPRLPLSALPIAENAAPASGKKEKTVDTQEVTVIAFSGLCPALRVEGVRVFFPAIGQILVDLPSYAGPVFGSKPAVTARNGAENREIELLPLLRTDVLAYRTLWDEVRMEVTFAVSRALARAGIAATTYAVARSNEDTRDYAPLVATLASALINMLADAMSESIRNWETLPNTGYLAVTDVPRGSTVTVSVGGDKVSMDLPPEVRGVIVMATELSNSNVKVHYVTY